MKKLLVAVLLVCFVEDVHAARTNFNRYFSLSLPSTNTQNVELENREETYKPRSWFDRLFMASTTDDDPDPETDQSTTTNANDAQSPNLGPNNKRETIFKYIKKKGRITFDFTHQSTKDNPDFSHELSDSNKLITATSSSPLPTTRQTLEEDRDILSVSLDPFATIRLARVFYMATSSFMMAFLGTLKLLGPLIFARRVLAQIGELVSDYMMGRYLRTTYDHIERKYWKEYQGPAASRSLGRCLVHLMILFQIGEWAESWVGLESPPCLIPNTGTCHWWCGLLWIVSVVGTGNIGATFMATRGPLRIKVTKRATRQQQQQLRKRRRVFIRPLQILQWMKDPDRWITEISTSRKDNAKYWKPFTPEPLLFPSTWPPFCMLRNVAVAKAMASSSNLVHNSMHLIMRQFLIQQACMDEWHRVLMEERRVSLGVFAIAIGFITTSSLFVTVALADRVSAVLMLPSLVAVFSSGWMNLFVFWDRRRDEAKRPLIVVQRPTDSSRPRRAFESPTYAIKW